VSDIGYMAWVRIDGSAANARAGLEVDATRQGVRVVHWADPPATRERDGGVEWLCRVEHLDPAEDDGEP
jgi:hypothetical protein